MGSLSDFESVDSDGNWVPSCKDNFLLEQQDQQTQHFFRYLRPFAIEGTVFHREY